MPGRDQAVELQDLRLQPAQLFAESSCTCPSYLGYARVIGVCNDPQKLFDATAPDRRNNAKLGKMGAKCIGYGVLLANEKMPRAVEHQAALLLWSLSLYKPHGRPPHRLANRLRVCGIVLLSLDIRLHVGWRHQPNRMAKRFELP
jgi:hypothetical protein